MHYAITGFVTMFVLYWSGSFGITLIMLVSYLLLVDILYLTAKLLVRGTSYYKSLACCNWYIIIMIIVFFIWSVFMISGSPDIREMVFSPEMFFKLRLWNLMLLVLSFIIFVRLVNLIMKVNWLPSMVISILFLVMSYIFSKLLALMIPPFFIYLV